LTPVCGERSVQEQHGRISPTISVIRIRKPLHVDLHKADSNGAVSRNSPDKIHFFGASSIFLNAACCFLTLWMQEAVYRRGG